MTGICNPCHSCSINCICMLTDSSINWSDRSFFDFAWKDALNNNRNNEISEQLSKMTCQVQEELNCNPLKSTTVFKLLQNLFKLGYEYHNIHYLFLTRIISTVFDGSVFFWFGTLVDVASDDVTTKYVNYLLVLLRWFHYLLN